MKEIDFNALIKEMFNVIKEEAVEHLNGSMKSFPHHFAFTTVRIEVSVGQRISDSTNSNGKNFKRFVLVHVNN